MKDLDKEEEEGNVHRQGEDLWWHDGGGRDGHRSPTSPLFLIPLRRGDIEIWLYGEGGGKWAWDTGTGSVSIPNRVWKMHCCRVGKR